MISDELVERALQKIKLPVDYEHFFESINSSDWIKPLQKKGYFREPRGPIPTGDDSYQLPLWVESRYLARVASKAPDLVVSVIKAIPETKNPRIHADYIDAALAMPPSTAVKLAGIACKWLDSDYAFSFPQKYGAYIEHLAKGGIWRTTFALCESLMALGEKDRFSKPIAELGERKTAIPKFSDWEYEQLLEKMIPVLGEKFPIDTIKMLSKLLKRALEIEGECTALDGGNDYSYIWRPTIAHDEHGHFGDVKEKLLDSLRDTIIRATKMAPELVAPIIEVLDDAMTPLHQRVVLFSLVSAGDEYKVIKASKLLNEQFILGHSYWREYAALLRRNFGQLKIEQQISILSVIDRGPPQVVKGEIDENGKKQRAQYARRWRLDRLYILRGSLSGDRKKDLETLIKEFGEPEDPENPEPRFESWVGPTTPKTIDELRPLNTDQIIEYLRAWVPVKDHRSPSPSGLGRSLSQIVKERPVEFIERFPEFQTLNITYVRSVFDGLIESVEKIHGEWNKVLSFAEWVVCQPTRRDPSIEFSSYDEDPHWGWAKMSIARLIHRGLDAESEVGLPFDQRKSTWTVLEKLTWENSPTQEEDERYLESSRDAFELSINTVRGEALHTVVAYALWVSRNTGNSDLHAKFRLMPEVRENLDAHLDPQREQSAVVRSVFGRWIPWLQFLDEAWTHESMRKIFPDDNEHFWETAWSAFVLRTKPYDDVFEMTKGQYGKAIQRLAQSKSSEGSAHSSETRLAEHLMSFYWGDGCALSIESKIITDFFLNADPMLRQHALTWVGRMLKSVKEPVPEAVLEKMRRLFEWRLSVHLANKDIDHKEVEDFGWWIASTRFQPDWYFPLAEQVLDLCKSIDPMFMVLEVAKEDYQNHPELVVRFISKLVDSAQLTTAFYGWNREMEAILRLAISSDGALTEVAKNITQKLIAMGFKNFKDLLK